MLLTRLGFKDLQGFEVGVVQVVENLILNFGDDPRSGLATTVRQVEGSM